MTANQERGPSRDWIKMVRTSRARNKIRAWFREERRDDAERDGREALAKALRKHDLPPQKFAGSPMLADVMREMGFRKADDFYIALGRGKISAKTTAKKLLQRLRAGEVIEPAPVESVTRPGRRASAEEASEFGIVVEGVDNVPLRLAKCCLPVPGDEILGYVSLGRGITIHRTDCRNVSDLSNTPERLVNVAWEGENETTFEVEIQIDAYDRTRLLEDLAKTFAEVGVNILSATCATSPPMVKNTFVVEVADTGQMKQCINRMRQVESVFDAYRITPSG
jgi:GTP pyrophosphokinase